MNLLKQALDLLKFKVDNYNGGPEMVEIFNISNLSDDDESLTSNSPIILSVINMEEDKVARSPQVYYPIQIIIHQQNAIIIQHNTLLRPYYLQPIIKSILMEST